MIREYPDARQNAGHNCGDAAVVGALVYKGVTFEAGTIALADDADGMHPSTIYAVLRKHLLKLQSGTLDLEDLKYHTKRKRPVICPIDVFGGHWVTVLGVARKYVHYHCPARGRQRLPHDEFLRLWRDSTREGHPFTHWGIIVL